MQLLSHFLDQLSPICLEQWHQNIWFQAFHPKLEEDWNSFIKYEVLGPTIYNK